MEFLWVDLQLAGIDLEASGDATFFAISTGSPPTATPNIGDGETIAAHQAEVQFVTSGLNVLIMPLRLDLTDKNGYGQLVATDRLNLSGTAVGQAAATSFVWRIYYRYVTVTVEEYIGIIQSQLTS